MSARGAAGLAAIVLGVTLVVSVLATTPWRSLPGVPGGSTPVDPARDFTAAQIERENAFHRAVRPPAYTALALSLLVVLVLGFTSLGARLVGSLARPLGGGWFTQVLVGVIAFLVIGVLATLPLRMRSETVLRRYGLSTQSWRGWFADQAKGLAVSVVIGILVFGVFYALVRAMPRWWWVPAAALGAAFVLAASFLYPVLIEPLFNKFTPMQDGPLRTSLIQLAEQDGQPVRDVLVADASKRTTALNAYVSGLGSTRRIVVFDTTERDLTAEEIRVIVAHELGHAKERDVAYGTAIGALGLAVGVCLLAFVLGGDGSALLRRAGVTSLRDPRSLALVIALVTLASQLGGPLQMLVSRRIEARADVHALSLTRDPTAFVEMQQRLSVANLADLDPNPLVYALFVSHPTGPERIALARDWEKLHAPASTP